MGECDLRARLDAHHDAAFGWALHCCAHRREEAEDVLQTAYLKIVDGRARYGGASGFRTWLFALIRNTAAERKRSWVRRLLREARELGKPAAAAGNPEPEESLALRAALEKLSARQREALHLVFYQDMTLDEAAAVMGVSPGSARTHYERGKASLRKILGERVEAGVEAGRA